MKIIGMALPFLFAFAVYIIGIIAISIYEARQATTNPLDDDWC